MLLAMALTLGGVAACGSDVTTGPTVETVVLAGVPADAMRVGGSAQLVATTLSGTGSAINGAAVTWKSSDAAVATVNGAGVVTAVAAGEVTVTASSGRGTATAEIVVVAPLLLSPGVTVALPGGGLSLTAPSGGGGPLVLLVGPGSAALADDKVVPGTIHQIAIEPGSSTYFSGVTLSLRYDPARLPAGVTADGLQLYRRVGSSWVAIPRSKSDPGQRTVTGAFPGAGTYAARQTSVNRLALSGMQVDGALYVGQSAKLGAAAISADGDTLANRPATWTTSAPGVVTVDAQGTITGASPGTATITASAEGVSATTQVQVLTRPVASWTGTLDWTTYRANNRRTGYVDVTLDPVTFAKKWEVTFSSTGNLNEVATGSGNVYVSSDSYVGEQSLWALDAATGAVRWTRAFGSIHTVNGPATGNGRVYVSTAGHEDSFLWSFDAADGTVMFRSAYDNHWSRWQAPAVTADVVFLGSGYYGGMSAFGALDGTVLWSRGLPQEDTWTPAADGDRTYAFGDDGTGHGLLSIDGRTGDATVVAPNLGLPRSGTPVIGGANDVYGTRDSRLFAIDLARSVVAWDLPGSYQGVPALDGSNVYAVLDGQVEARRRSDGALVWTWVPQAGLFATGSLVVTRNLAFVQLVPGGFSANAGRIVAIDLATRKVVWSYDAGGPMVLGNGLLIITSRSGAKVTAIAVR